MSATGETVDDPGTGAAWVADALTQSVPWVQTAGVGFLDVSAERAVLAIPDDPSMHNHVGGPHAAMIFGVGETASGAVTLAAFADVMGRASPLVVRAEIAYRKLARGSLTAEAVLQADPVAVLAELDSGGRPEFAVRVEIRNAEQVTTAELTVVWTLRPNR